MAIFYLHGDFLHGCGVDAISCAAYQGQKSKTISSALSSNSQGVSELKLVGTGFGSKAGAALL